MTPIESKLYVIVDIDTCRLCNFPVADFTRAVCAAKPRYVQLRAKHATSRETLEWLDVLVTAAQQQGVVAFANDRADLALLARADGVHVGQEDLPVAEIRRIAPGLRVGFSTHREAQMREALTLGLDYVAFGPIYSTKSKENPDEPVGIAGLVTAARLARSAQIPLVAIGGITRECLPEVGRYADYVAVIGASIPESGRIEDVTAHVSEINRIVSARNLG